MTGVAESAAASVFSPTPTEDVIRWMIDFVEAENPAFDGWAPCPYARRARIQNKVRFVEAGPSEWIQAVEIEITRFNNGENSAFDLAVIISDSRVDWPIEKFSVPFRDLKQQGARAGLHLMRDHPDDREIINGVRMNQGTYVLIFLQKRELLDQATADLKRSGYYDSWPREAYEVVVGPREKK